MISPRLLLILAAAIPATPIVAVAANAANTIEPGSGAGLWAAVGAFLGQMVAARFFVQKEVREGIAAHVLSCPAIRKE